MAQNQVNYDHTILEGMGVLEANSALVLAQSVMSHYQPGMTVLQVMTLIKDECGADVKSETTIKALLICLLSLR